MNGFSHWYFEGGQLVQARLAEEEGVEPFCPVPQVAHGAHDVPVKELDA
jgi:hypothetical protein